MSPPVYLHHGNGRDVVCTPCAEIPEIVRDYCSCERDELDLERDGYEVAIRATDEASGLDYWRRYRRVTCCICGETVMEMEL